MILVILVKILVNLPVKLTKLGNMIDTYQDYLDKTPSNHPQESPEKIESRKGVAVYFLAFLPVYE